jgi:hypothetical protein
VAEPFTFTAGSIISNPHPMSSGSPRTTFSNLPVFNVLKGLDAPALAGLSFAHLPTEYHTMMHAQIKLYIANKFSEHKHLSTVSYKSYNTPFFFLAAGLTEKILKM